MTKDFVPLAVACVVLPAITIVGIAHRFLLWSLAPHQQTWLLRVYPRPN